MKGFDYRTQKPVELTGRELAKLKREHVAAGGKVNQVTTPQGKEIWFKQGPHIAMEVYL